MAVFSVRREHHANQQTDWINTEQASTVAIFQRGGGFIRGPKNQDFESMQFTI